MLWQNNLTNLEKLVFCVAGVNVLTETILILNVLLIAAEVKLKDLTPLVALSRLYRNIRCLPVAQGHTSSLLPYSSFLSSPPLRISSSTAILSFFHSFSSSHHTVHRVLHLTKLIKVQKKGDQELFRSVVQVSTTKSKKKPL